MSGPPQAAGRIDEDPQRSREQADVLQQGVIEFELVLWYRDTRARAPGGNCKAGNCRWWKALPQRFQKSARR